MIKASLNKSAIRAVLKKNKMSLKDFAEEAGISRTVLYSKYKFVFGVDTEKIAKILKVSIEDIAA